MEYSSYRQLESRFDVAHQNIAPYLERVCLAIVDKLYPTVAGFGTEHDISLDIFEDNYGTDVIRMLSETFFDGKVILGSLDGTYHACEEMGGIKGAKALFNSADNKRYTIGKVRKIYTYTDYLFK